MTKLIITATVLLLATSFASSQPAFRYAPSKPVDLTCPAGIPADECERLNEAAVKCQIWELLIENDHALRNIKRPACPFALTKGQDEKP